MHRSGVCARSCGKSRRLRTWLGGAVAALGLSGCSGEPPQEPISTVSQAVHQGPVAAYAFDESSGTAIVDASGNGHNSTLNGQTRVVGRHGGALEFENS